MALSARDACVVAFCRAAGTDTTWFLTETTLRARGLQRVLDEAIPNASYRCLSRGDSVFELLRGISALLDQAALVRPIAEVKKQLILSELLLTDTRFTRLTNFVSTEGRVTGVERSMRGIQSFVDTTRLYQVTERYISALVDDWGNAKPQQELLEELILLTGAYGESLYQRREFDYAGGISFLLELLNLPRLLKDIPRILPGKIVYVEPSHLFPIEEQLISALGKIVTVVFAIDAPVMVEEANLPSARYVQPLRSYVVDSNIPVILLPTLYPERQALVDVAIDLVARSCENDLVVIPCESRESEVHTTFSLITKAIENGENPNSFHVFCFDLDKYFPQIREKSEKLTNFTVNIPKGEAPIDSAAICRFRLFLDWIVDPSPATAHAYYSSPLARGSNSIQGLWQAFYDRNADRMQRLLKAPLIAQFGVDRFLAELGSHRTFDAGALLLFSRRHEMEFTSFKAGSWIESFLSALTLRAAISEESLSKSIESDHEARLILDILRAIIILEADLYVIREDLAAEQLCREIMRLFQRTRRWNSKSLSSCERDERGRRYMMASRRIFHSVRALRKAFSSEMQPCNISLPALKALLGETITRTTEFTTTETEEVLVTDFLDSRSVHDKHIYLLGANSELLEQFVTGQTNVGTEIHDITRLVQSKRSDSSRYAEFDWLLAQILRNNRTVTVLFSGSNSDGLPAASPFVSEIVRAGAFVAMPSEHFSRSVREELPSTLAIRARRGSAFSAWDGVIAGDMWAKREGQRKYSVRGTNTYSPSALEMIADCAHRFFFSRVIRINGFERALSDELSAHLGEIVHSCLSELFRTTPFRSETLTKSNMAVALSKMKSIAARKFEESPVDWNWNSRFRAARESIISGLDNTSWVEKGGILKAALRYLCELELGAPHDTEISFGISPTACGPPFIIEGEGGTIEIIGRIDRIDRDPDSGQYNAVWDYKTSRKRVTRKDLEQGRSLQVPLYLAYVSTNSLGPANLSRAGIIYLGDPSVPRELLKDEKEGVFQSIFSSDPSAEVLGQEIADNALEQVRKLDAKVRAGNFAQQLNTQGCNFCEFSTICARDENLLNMKLGKTTESSPRTLLSRDNVKSVLSEVRVERIYSPEQLAVLDISRNYSVLAGAGSGKTSVLQGRIMELILAGKPLSSVLAITFTEKAAHEIKLRLESTLRLAIESKRYSGRMLSDIEFERLRSSHGLLADCSLGTIHSFAGRVVRMDPILSGWLADAQKLDESRRQALIERAVHFVLLGSGPGHRNQNLEYILGSGISYSQVVATITALVKRPSELRRLSAQSEKLASDEDSIEPLLSSIKIAGERKLASLIQLHFANIALPFGEWIERFERFSESEREVYRGAKLQLDALLQISSNKSECGELFERYVMFEDYIREYHYVRKIKSKSNPRNYWYELRDRCSEITDQVGRWDKEQERLGIILANSIIHLASQVETFYCQEKQRLGVADFDDIILGAHAVLCGKFSGDLRVHQQRVLARVRNEFPHVLVDEFQDTDFLQWDIVRAIWGGETLAERTLFIVGDGKQSIYRFRGGDMRVFNCATEEIERSGGCVAALSDNYRSAPPVVAFVNAIFDPIFLSDFVEPSKARAKSAVLPQVMNAKRGSANADGVGFIWTLHSNYQTRMESEAQHVASFVNEILTGKLDIYDSILSCQKKRGPQIAILTATVSQLHRAANALCQRGVPFLVSHTSGFYESEEIKQFWLLARALQSPSDEVALVGLLRSPLVGLSDADLLALYDSLAEGWQSVWHQDSDIQKEVLATIRRWRDMAAFMGVSELLVRIVGERELLSAYAGLGYLDAEFAIERFLETVRDAELSGELRGGLANFVHWFEEKRDHGRDAPDISRSESPLILSTIHGAKGLEFPIVILPFLEDRVRSSGRIRWGEVFLGAEMEPAFRLGMTVPDTVRAFRQNETVLSSLLRDSEWEEYCAERRRLFYVACTRAIDALVLSIATKADITDDEQEYRQLDFTQRRDKMFSSSSAHDWIRCLGRLEGEGTNPQALLFDRADAPPLRVPVLSRSQ